MWSEASVPQSQWVSQFEFRASGPERGGGNLQLWYTKEGQWSIGSSSIYTVGAFDGLAIVIDSYGGKGGGIRGFMNDGTIDYKNYHSVDSLAFGHCDYSYRNLGRPSKVQIKQEHSVFEVVVDDKICFSTDKVRGSFPKANDFALTDIERYKCRKTTISALQQLQLRLQILLKSTNCWSSRPARSRVRNLSNSSRQPVKETHMRSHHQVLPHQNTNLLILNLQTFTID